MKNRSLILFVLIAYLTHSCGGNSEHEKTASTEETIFWSWFMTHSDKLYHFETNMEEVFANLSSEMHKLHTSLTFAFGPIEGDHRQFVISADGDQDAFPAVISLAAAAPEMPEWEIISFRPAVGTDSEVKFEGLKLLPEDFRFFTEWEAQSKTVALTLYILNYDPNDVRYKACSFLMMDNALGEYDTETKIGGLVFKDLNDAGDNSKEWHELPMIVDGYFK